MEKKNTPFFYFKKDLCRKRSLTPPESFDLGRFWKTNFTFFLKKKFDPEKKTEIFKDLSLLRQILRIISCSTSGIINHSKTRHDYHSKNIKFLVQTRICKLQFIHIWSKRRAFLPPLL